MKNGRRSMLQGDVIDLLTEEQAEKEVKRDIVMVKVDDIVPFHKHPFHLYTGNRLDAMVESIKKNGILIPVVVQPYKGKYEMLAGHNRLNAAVLAGLTEVPAIVKENLTEREAYIYVIETNVVQRSFAELLPSEQAAVLEVEYDKVFSQGRRNDIIREIEILSGIDTSDQIDQKLTGRDSVGQEHGMSGSTVARLLRINNLVQPFKEMVDENKIPKGAYFHISFIPEEKQMWIFHSAEELGLKFNEDIARDLRNQSEDLTEESVREIMQGLVSGKPGKQFQSVKLSTSIYEKYLGNVSTKEAVSIVEKALEQYFAQVI